MSQDTSLSQPPEPEPASEREPASEPEPSAPEPTGAAGEATDSGGEASSPSSSPARPSSPGRDRGRLYVLGATGALLALGVALIAVSPRKAANATTGIPLAASSELAGRADGSNVPGQAVVLDAGAPPPAVRPSPAWRVASLKDDPSVELVEGSFGKKGLVATLTQAGLARSEVRRLTKAFDGVRHIDRPGPTDSFVLAKDKGKGNAVVAFEYITSPFEVWQARLDPETAAWEKGERELDAKKLELYIEHKKLASSLVLGADLAKTIAASGLRPELVDQIDDALEGHAEPGALRTGVRMRLVSTEDFVEGAYARVKLEAIELLPKSGAPVRVYFYERDASVDGSSRRAPAAGFYDAKGRQPYHGQFRAPLALARITSRFNPNRMHPVLHVITPHNGVDYAGSPGTPVFAAASGTVTQAGNGGPCGNMVQIDHGGGLTTAYCHLKAFAPGLHAGQKVEARQNIGFVGQTGRVTGPHLHFVVKRNGAFVDPLSLKMDGVRVLPPADRDAFARNRAALDSAIDGLALPAVGPDAPGDKDEDKDDDKDLHGE